MPNLSVIVPYADKNSPQELEETLVSVLENRPDKTEIIVSNGGGYRDPYHLIQEDVRFIDLGREKSLVRCVNEAVEASQGKVINILSCGAVVEECWVNQPLRAFCDPDVAAVMTPVFDRLRSHRLVSTGIVYHRHGVINNRKMLTPVPDNSCVAPHAASGFFRRSVLQQIGGFSPSFCLQVAYLDYSLILTSLHKQIEIVPTSRVHYASQMPMFPSIFERSRQTEQLFLRWSHQKNWFYNMCANFLAVSAEFWGNFPYLRMYAFLGGRVAGLNHYGAHKIRQEELARLAMEFALEEKERNTDDSIFSMNPCNDHQEKRSCPKAA
ncbi:MAG: glycosyltransferase family 2 protein [Planctomycetaceae bacterium]|nr:glycosyltransferase family 2 protein [Planctomycetaceae bacterium]